MRTSEEGKTALIVEEGEVLTAYRCPAGRWTIGVGLTAASGVVAPRAGMRITREESRRLLSAALERNYEPAVNRAMTGQRGSAVIRPNQHEFDAGTLFHFNTGSIGRASWVKRWLAGASPDAIRAGLALWNKGGGKVLPGLVARRQREADMLLLGVYPGAERAVKPGAWATWGLRLSPNEKANVREALAKLGYSVTAALDRVPRSSVEAFQRDHDLTVDGIIGRATLSTLQRRIDASRRTVIPGTAAAGGSAGAAASLAMPRDLPEQIAPDVTDAVANLPAPALLGFTGLVVGGLTLWLLWLAYTYRDVIAAKTQRFLPRLAAFLRSF